jgi:hypothetical protein
VIENRVPEEGIGPKRDEVTRDCRKLQIEELLDLHFAQNTIRVMK